MSKDPDADLEGLLTGVRSRISILLAAKGLRPEDFGLDGGTEDLFFAYCRETEENLSGENQAPFPYLCGAFLLDASAQFALALALACETDAAVLGAMTAVNEDEGCAFPTPFAACALCGARISRLFESLRPGGGLDGLLSADSLFSPLRLDPRIRDFLISGNPVYEGLPYLEAWSGSAGSCRCSAEKLAVIRGRLQGADGHSLAVNLYGENGSGRRSCVRAFCAEQNVPAVFLDCAGAGNTGAAIKELRRECVLLRAVPVVCGEEALQAAQELRRLTEFFPVTFFVTENRVPPLAETETFCIDFSSVTSADARRVWAEETAGLVLEPDADLAELASEFCLKPGEIRRAAENAASSARSTGKKRIAAADLKRACTEILGPVGGNRARRVSAVYTWNDLILPAAQKELLKRACDQARYQYRVYYKWGFDRKVPYGRGVSMAFSGLPGTGKTMAAQVAANELGLELYKVDLAAVVSKYIGETEKNLNEIFAGARRSHAILFFDEADVLFGRRTEVKDSNDKYSNMEAAFLLQKMEDYDGITVLATNYIRNFDEAFRRRIRYLIDFPFPAQEERLQIWKKVFPRELPLGELDFDYLSGSFELSGSSIRNIALASAFLAAADRSGSVGMRHVLQAIRSEYAKSGKIFTREDAGQYYMLLD